MERNTILWVLCLWWGSTMGQSMTPLPVQDRPGGRSPDAAALNQRAYETYRTDPVQAKAFAYAAITAAERAGETDQVIDGYINLGRCFRFLLDQDSAFWALRLAARMSEAEGYLPGAMNAANNTGVLYLDQVALDSARLAFEASLAYARQIPDPHGQAHAMSNLAIIAQYRMVYDTALLYLNQALTAYQQSADSSAISRTFVNLAFVYDVLAQKDTAIGLYFKALTIQEDLGLIQQQAHTLNLIGDLHTDQNLLQAALPFFRRSLALATQIPDPRTSFLAAQRIGACLITLDSLEAAFPYLRQSLSFAQAWDSAAVGISYTNLGAWYARRPATQAQAWDYYTRALPYLQASPSPDLARLYTQMGQLAQAQGRWSEALAYFSQALEAGEEIDDLEHQKDACLGLSSLYRTLDNAPQALYYTDRYHQLKDSLVNSQSLETINSLRIAYGVEQKEKERILLESQLTQKALESKQQRLALWAALGGLLVILSLTYAVYYRQQRRAKERELARLQQIDRLKDQFLANTSHELRTPLNGIIGISEGLLGQTQALSPAEVDANLGMLIASGKRLASLVNDLLDFSRMRHADLALRQRPLDLRSLTGLIMQVLQPLTQGKGLALQNEVPAGLPAVFADEDRLSQILHNLLGNAIKFTERGWVQVTAEVQGDQVLVAVRDTGIGVPAERHTTIFNAFEQGDGSISREYSGTGLGLSITRELVERHGGRIWVESAPGQGATFCFLLPIATEEAQALSQGAARLTPLMPVAEPEALPTVTPTDQAAPIRILIVDDEPINHQVLRNHLRQESFELVSALSGQEALAIIEAGQHIDLILLDIMMPRLSGYEVAQRIRETHLPSELPIIMVTAKNQVSDLVQGLRTGANDYLAKPFSKDEFLARLRTHLNLHQIHTATRRFVPEEFLKTLGRNTITEVQVGDNISRELTVLFSDIRGYTSLSEQMTPQENFAFVNAFARRMGPVIQQHQGFVNQYLGDGIMAIFQHQPADALQAAIGMQQVLTAYNQRRQAQGRQTLRIGIGLHTGPLVMGIIGDNQRSDAAVIADTVNTSARLEGLNKYYGSQILLSEISYAELPPELAGLCRYVGQVQVKGRRQPLGLYECFGGDEAHTAQQKARSREAFEAAIAAFLAGDMGTALRAFAPMATAGDLVATRFLAQARRYATEGLPDNWVGVEVMEEK